MKKVFHVARAARPCFQMSNTGGPPVPEDFTVSECEPIPWVDIPAGATQGRGAKFSKMMRHGARTVLQWVAWWLEVLFHETYTASAHSAPLPGNAQTGQERTNGTVQYHVLCGASLQGN